MRLERAWTVPDRREEGRGELPAQDRGGLEDALRLLGQAVDARGEDAVHGVWDRETCHESLVADRPSQLLEEERIALGLVEDQPGERVTGVRDGQDRPDDREALVRRQPPERELGRKRPIAPGRPVAGAIGGDQQDGHPDEALGEEREALLGRPVHPVKVLDLQHERLLAAPAQAQLSQGLEGPRLDDFRAERLQPARRVLPAEQAKEIGLLRVGVHADLLEPEAHLLRDRLRGVGVDEPAVSPDDVHHGDVRDGRAVGEAPALKVRNAQVHQAVAELEEEPRLPDPGLADDPDRLAPAFLDGGEQGQQRLELPVTADEVTQP